MLLAGSRVACAYHLPMLVDRIGKAILPTQRAQIGQDAALPEKGMHLALGCAAIARNLLAVVDRPSIALACSQRTQVGHGPIFPKEGVELVPPGRLARTYDL